MEKSWKIFKSDANLARSLAGELKISALIAQILINRGIDKPKEAEIFLNPRLNHLRSPMEIPNIAEAAKRVLLAKEKGEKVFVFGDYDVDGVTGTAILLHTLNYLGIAASYYIPDRYGEGYSFSAEAIKKIADSGAKLIISVDCGIASFAEIDQANSLGIEVIVTDHHNLPDRLPPAFAIVNPKMIAGSHPSKDLSGAGVAFKFAWALLRIAGRKDSVFLTSLLDLASLGTISDVVPLTAENRILAANGLNLINGRKRLGIKHLAEAASLNGKISVNNIYFGLAPRINAAGRLEHASKSVELMLTDDSNQAKSLAEELNDINVRRRGIGSDIKDEVFSRLSDAYAAENRVLVLWGKDWHPGVIGIVASQVADRYYRPVVLVGVNGGVGRGSARSIDGVNIFNILNSCRDLFIDFGGHAGAAGFEIDPGNIAELQKRLKHTAGNFVSAEDLKPGIIIDAEIMPAQISLGLIKELDVFDPHGEGNPPPVFMTRNLKLYDLRVAGKDGRHLKAKFTDGNITLDTIGFNLGDLAEKLSYNKSYDIAYRLEANEWDGFENAQLCLIDIREAKR